MLLPRVECQPSPVGRTLNEAPTLQPLGQAGAQEMLIPCFCLLISLHFIYLPQVAPLGTPAPFPTFHHPL